MVAKCHASPRTAQRGEDVAVGKLGPSGGAKYWGPVTSGHFRVYLLLGCSIRLWVMYARDEKRKEKGTRGAVGASWRRSYCIHSTAGYIGGHMYARHQYPQATLMEESGAEGFHRNDRAWRTGTHLIGPWVCNGSSAGRDRTSMCKAGDRLVSSLEFRGRLGGSSSGHLRARLGNECAMPRKSMTQFL